ncbi:hypothetical protein GQ651_05295 [Alphaproteobacteria bacterium GH1-50]|uniref:Dolichyl-phosphate-mannose-protein mannosyltransferase n=1 Tax=Kangsaoukella pontilimi TaxID=2691042 RepID=A0A7C9MER9_9RHOB|nr:hypothetical protein [Kangsaoukella pontilimi]MXQ07256.1 hypothetical protein [Kangsaoukella pontilimi]
MGEALLVLAFLAALLAFALKTALSREVLEEWDAAMQFASGSHFWESGIYTGWASHFWPPFQPLLLGLGDPFDVGRAVSLTSYAAVLAIAYAYLRLRGIDSLAALIGTAFIGGNAHVLLMGLQVENHALETAFVLAAFVVASRFRDTGSAAPLLICALLLGLAGLTRYTSYAAALVVGLLLLFSRPGGLRSFLLYSAVFVMVSLPWWVHNTAMNGSPLHSWQYMNIGSSLHEAGPANWWWVGQESFGSLGDVIAAYPKAFFENWRSNLAESLELILESMGTNDEVAGGLLVTAVVVAVMRKRRRAPGLGVREFILSVPLAAGFAALASIAFVFSEALLPASLVMCASLVAYVLASAPKARFVILGLAVLNGWFAIDVVNSYVAGEARDNGQLVDNDAVRSKLVALGVHSESLVTSIHPTRMLGLEGGWILRPLAGYNTFCGFLAYDFGPRVTAYVPRIPVTQEIRPPDFVVFDPSLADLFSTTGIVVPDEGRCPDTGVGWKRHAVSEEVSVIEVLREGRP